MQQGVLVALYQFVVLTGAQEGREQEFADWYDQRHLADVSAVPGIKSARRFPVVKIYGENPPKWTSVALYEIETDGDPQEVVAAIHKRAFTEQMPVSDAYDRRFTVQIIAHDRERSAKNAK